VSYCHGVGKVNRASPPGPRDAHTVQFFDLVETLGVSVGRFVHENMLAGRVTLLVARPTTIAAISGALRPRDVSLQDLIDAGRVVVQDAATLLRSFADHRGPQAAKFEATVAPVVARLAGDSPGGLAIYGEMVDLFASEGNFEAAEALERLWNDLAQKVPFRLLCGYAAAHFAASQSVRSHLRCICDLHSDVQRDQADLLADWLLNSVSSSAGEA